MRKYTQQSLNICVCVCVCLNISARIYALYVVGTLKCIIKKKKKERKKLLQAKIERTNGSPQW